LLLGSGGGVLETSGGLLTVREAADLLRLRPVTIYRLCAEGMLAHVRVSNAIRISLAALDALIRSNRP